jgi:hypothetical protein
MYIEPKGLSPNVHEIISKLAFWTHIFRNVNGGQTGKTWPYAQPIPETGDFLISYSVALFIFDNLTNRQRSWSHKTHITREDVKHLGKLVQTHGT